MKPLLVVLLALLAAAACASVRGASRREPRSLFNGKDLAGWHADVPAADTSPRLRNPFLVRNGLLVTLGEPRGHLITDSTYRDYRLEVEYRFPAAPGNAGVLVHASTPRALYGMFPRSIEVQMESGNAGDFWCILEDIRVPDMERRRGPPAQWGTTEGKARRILNLTDDSERPVGEWNVMVIEAVGRAVRVWVNGDLVNDGFDATADRGRIALQSEGAEVEFRRLVLTPISSLTPAAARRSAVPPEAGPIIPSGHERNPYGIQWMRFEPECPLPDLVKTVPHVAFEVDDLHEAIAGQRLLIAPNSPSPGVLVAFVLCDGAPVELLQFVT